ncbi:MAG: antitoxin VapB family protein [Promethearchaeota archaeon]
MAQKTISLPEKTYHKLAKIKKNHETYSDLILRLIDLQEPEKIKNLEMFYGQLQEDFEGEWDKIGEQIYLDRLDSKRSEITFEDD